MITILLDIILITYPKPFTHVTEKAKLKSSNAKTWLFPTCVCQYNKYTKIQAYVHFRDFEAFNLFAAKITKDIETYLQLVLIQTLAINVIIAFTLT